MRNRPAGCDCEEVWCFDDFFAGKRQLSKTGGRAIGGGRAYELEDFAARHVGRILKAWVAHFELPPLQGWKVRKD